VKFILLGHKAPVMGLLQRQQQLEPIQQYA